MTICIVEGLDNCGKSTLITGLQTALTPKTPLVLKYSNIKKITPEQHQEYYLNLYRKTFDLFFTNKDIILDRFILGEHVYSPIYRGYTTEALTELEETYLNRYPNINNQMGLILLIDEPEHLLIREDGLSLSTNNIEKIKSERIAFINAFNKCKMKHKLLIDISNKDIPTVLELALEFIRKIEHA